MVENKKDGFRIGDYFISFPPGDFVKEEKDGRLSIEVEIYKIENDRVTKVKDNIAPELEEAIGEEINRILAAAIENENINKWSVPFHWFNKTRSK